MENTQPIIIQDTNIPITGEKKPKNKKLLFIIIGAVVLILAGLAVAFFILKFNKTTENPDGPLGPDGQPLLAPESLTPDGEVAEAVEIAETLTDQTSRESYVAYQTSLLETGSAEDSFEARLALASYYISILEFENAAPLLIGVDTSNYSTEDFYRYYNVLTRYYDGIGDTAARDDANTRSSEYRNLLQQEAAEREGN